MQTSASRIAALMLKKLSGQLSAEEVTELQHWRASSAANQIKYEQLMNLNFLKGELTAYKKAEKVGETLSMPVIDEAEIAVIHPMNYMRRWGWAAAILILLGTGAYLWNNNQGKKDIAVTNSNKRLQTDVQPGGNKAILTLADGRSIELDSATNGILAHQGNTKIIKLQNGQIAYDLKGSAAEVMTNTMTTPRGGQYRLALPDGTQVWLNAASSITYPTAFTGSERKVKVTGEAYFEVTSNPSIPFKVQINESATVEVLGTRFNIDSYGDAGTIKTTLLEGSIRTTVRSPHQQKDVAVLNPGQQAQIRPSEKIKVVSNVDLETVMAWKNGLFNFENASLQEVMQQLARWYDIEVVYEKGVPEMNFGGEISRNVSLAGLLNGLQNARVHFRIEEGRRLIVMP